jgi:hypothetical protein
MAWTMPSGTAMSAAMRKEIPTRKKVLGRSSPSSESTLMLSL